MSVVDPRLFYPIDWRNVQILDEKQDDTYWDELFRKSVAVHFYGGFHYYGDLSQEGKKKLAARNKNILRPKFYGKHKPALSYLGSKECPLSFFSTRSF